MFTKDGPSHASNTVICEICQKDIMSNYNALFMFNLHFDITVTNSNHKFTGVFVLAFIVFLNHDTSFNLS